MHQDKAQHIEKLLQNSWLWRASHTMSPIDSRQQPAHSSAHNTIATGFKQLDTQLKYGGWPWGKLIECLGSRHNTFSLFLPAIQQLALNQDPIVLIDPPYTPYLPGWPGKTATLLWVIQTHSLTERLWAAGEVLRSNSAAATLIWLKDAEKKLRPSHTQLRKLQLAATRCEGLTVVLREFPHGYFPQSDCRQEPLQKQASPAALRLTVTPVLQTKVQPQVRAQQNTNLQVHILKQPGHWAGQKVSIAWHRRLQTPSMTASEWPVYLPVQPASQYLPETSEQSSSQRLPGFKYS